MKPIAYVGIDPGKTGAASLISADTGDIIGIIDWQNPAFVADSLRQWQLKYIIRLAVLEKVHAMPKQGVTSTFTFAENFGAWQGMLAALVIPHELVSPQKWQKGLFRKSDGDGKKRSLAVVRRLYPVSVFFKRVKDHDRADATLMARFAMSIYKK
jgi:hypothetical protein